MAIRLIETLADISHLYSSILIKKQDHESAMKLITMKNMATSFLRQKINEERTERGCWLGTASYDGLSANKLQTQPTERECEKTKQHFQVKYGKNKFQMQIKFVYKNFQKVNSKSALTQMN